MLLDLRFQSTGTLIEIGSELDDVSIDKNIALVENVIAEIFNEHNASSKFDFKTILNGYPRSAILAIAVLITISSSIVDLLLTEKGLMQIQNNSSLAIIIAIISTVPGFAVNLRAAIIVFDKLLDCILFFCRRTTEDYYESSILTGITSLLFFCLISIPASASGGYIAYTTLENEVPKEAQFSAMLFTMFSRMIFSFFTFQKILSRSNQYYDFSDCSVKNKNPDIQVLRRKKSAILDAALDIDTEALAPKQAQHSYSCQAFTHLSQMWHSRQYDRLSSQDSLSSRESLNKIAY
ncbi:MAG: hypothetical protein KBD83_06420 [Gammaproteobacteria bacterium]|nr:hypothetical protein [Gammaproteobacteria bacterium]